MLASFLVLGTKMLDRYNLREEDLFGLIVYRGKVHHGGESMSAGVSGTGSKERGVRVSNLAFSSPSFIQSGPWEGLFP